MFVTLLEATLLEKTIAMQALKAACLARVRHAVGAQADGHFGGATGIGVAQRPQVRRGVGRRRVGAEAVNAQLL